MAWTTFLLWQVREVGLLQKQASALFQAVSCETRVEANIFYNGQSPDSRLPRCRAAAPLLSLLSFSSVCSQGPAH